MQFFIIHNDPKTNAKLLPDYALKRVNVREGWQILSDIGHNLGITWEGQNKAYSIWHAETRKFMVNRGTLETFIKHYHFCLDEYLERYGKETVFHKRFKAVSGGKLLELLAAVPRKRTHEEFICDYMLRAKRDKLSNEEIKQMEKIYK